MKHASGRSKVSRQDTPHSPHRPIMGPKGVSIAPPVYGIDFVDRQQSTAEALTVQRYSGETSLPPAKQRENRTGLPDHLKAGIENLSGFDLSDVNVHFNSAKPTALQALAYTQGSDIHVAPGQERHLPHEAWHVVQQAQGRVQPTFQLKGEQINDDQGLEHEAEVMGARAVGMKAKPTPLQFSQERTLHDEAFSQRMSQNSLGEEAPLSFLSSRESAIQCRLGLTLDVDAAVVRHEPTADEVGWKVRSRSKPPWNIFYTLDYPPGGNVKGGVKPDDPAWGPDDPGGAARAASRAAYDNSLRGTSVAQFDYTRIIHSPGYDRTDFRYWVYYMLEQITEREQKKLFLQEVFEPDESRTVKAALANDSEKKHFLQQIFKLGFVSYEQLAQEQKKVLVAPGAQLANPVPGETRFGYGFRGDNRAPDELLHAGGFTTKADATDVGFRKKMGLDQLWNPFADQSTLPGQNITNNAGYFRRGDTDNDLTTIISVTPNFVDATKFPFIQEYMDGTSVVDNNGQQRRRSMTHVYLVLVEEGFDTKGAQGSNAFPEIATRSVPIDNVVAVYDIERTHFGSTTPQANDGHVAKLVSHRILDRAKARYGPTPAWDTIMRAVETYATLGELEYEPTKAAPVHQRIQMAVKFKSRVGQNLFVTGSISELGGWDPGKAVPMQFRDTETWALDLPLLAHNSISKGQRFEYKFLVKEGSSVRWEANPNHDYDPAVRVGTSIPERWHE